MTFVFSENTVLVLKDLPPLKCFIPLKRNFIRAFYFRDYILRYLEILQANSGDLIRLHYFDQHHENTPI